MRLVFWAACAAFLVPGADAFAQRNFDLDILRETFGFDDATKKSVELDQLTQGCQARDCIPAIDHPEFVTAGEADHITDDAMVITIAYRGEYRAYPARILDHHEIVNDTIAGDPLAITWCPLCGSAVGIRRIVAGEVTTFGVSGVLYNSDLVLYDRVSETLWDQIKAQGIVGQLTGEQLQLVPVSMSRWSVWRNKHPDTLVLSPNTGFDYDYTLDRYASYRDSSSLMFPVARTDDRVQAKTVVFGFALDSGAIAYPESLLQETGAYRHDLDGEEAIITLHDDGAVTMRRAGQTHHPVRLFWFAWYNFHPATDLIH
ncbi:MAG: DUF3179 domain-containing protein [Proteobacteria bacterium]|nr:DUF3179 domain-containing protein [Pseudomonadota bacterium]